MDARAVQVEIDMGDDAYTLLKREMPSAARRFNAVDKAIRALLADVQEHFPEACYYTGSGGFNLLLGPSHDNDCNGQQQMVALSGKASIGDGDW